MIVAIDGPSGVGKSTVARIVAERLDIPYLETGAMYRALGLDIVERGIDASDRDAVEAAARNLDLVVAPREDGRFEILVSGRPVGAKIYGMLVSEVTSKTSAYPGVRQRMRELQRRCTQATGGVLEGRDIGTRVVPDTPHKFFLTAAPEVRAERRWLQLRDAGEEIDLADVERDVRERDERDSTRRDSPLHWDETYTVVDTGEIAVHQVVEAILEQIESTNEAAGAKSANNDSEE